MELVTQPLAQQSQHCPLTGTPALQRRPSISIPGFEFGKLAPRGQRMAGKTMEGVIWESNPGAEFLYKGAVHHPSEVAKG